jgi:hypothetical protein
MRALLLLNIDVRFRVYGSLMRFPAFLAFFPSLSIRASAHASCETVERAPTSLVRGIHSSMYSKGSGAGGSSSSLGACAVAGISTCSRACDS